ncbi:ABC transporter permease [Actinomyces sp.]|uniref:ABC transporter permease n=1 Tax=Actinomyces sp. TaxID=29317 RepID=UPI00289F2993|nr:ABC transporter permease [Actinomyces sp.]
MIPSLIAVLILGLTAWGILTVIGAEKPWLQMVALGRAALQLGLLSVVLRWVVADLRLTVLFLCLMTGVAVVTAHRRAPSSLARPGPIAVALAAGWVAPVLVIVALGAVPISDTSKVLAMSGIVIGNSMTATSLLMRNLASRLTLGADQYLAWLALGATPRQAARPAVREAVSMSVMPATDQARTTGLVTLPGAFVGALFAGSSALEAARFQILVLAAILCANALTALVLTRFLGAPTTLLSDGQFTTRASAPAPAH